MDKSSFDELLEVVSILRSPKGCPWDIKQTHETLVPSALEEIYELIDAINKRDSFKIKDELGDVLLQVLLHSQIASESGDFDIFDVSENIREKLVRRHPHVFNNVEIEGVEEVLKNWEEIKRSEKGNEDRKSALDGVPDSFPALLRAYKLGKKAAQKGFDFENNEDTFSKVSEEVQELKEELFTNCEKEFKLSGKMFKEEEIFSGMGSFEKEAGFSNIEEELGDLLFAICNLARKLEINPELALNKASDKFYRRFNELEKQVIAQNRDLSSMTLEEMDEIWNAIKKGKY